MAHIELILRTRIVEQLLRIQGSFLVKLSAHLEGQGDFWSLGYRVEGLTQQVG